MELPVEIWWMIASYCHFATICRLRVVNRQLRWYLQRPYQQVERQFLQGGLYYDGWNWGPMGHCLSRVQIDYDPDGYTYIRGPYRRFSWTGVPIDYGLFLTCRAPDLATFIACLPRGAREDICRYVDRRRGLIPEPRSVVRLYQRPEEVCRLLLEGRYISDLGHERMRFPGLQSVVEFTLLPCVVVRRLITWSRGMQPRPSRLFNLLRRGSVTVVIFITLPVISLLSTTMAILMGILNVALTGINLFARID